MSEVFDELALEKEIYKQWGPGGAHASVYLHLLKKNNERAALQKRVNELADDLTKAEAAAKAHAVGWKLLEQVNQYLGHLQDSLEGTPHATAVADVVGDFRKALTGHIETRPAYVRYYAYNGNIYDRQSNDNPICYPCGGMKGIQRLLAALNGGE